MVWFIGGYFRVHLHKQKSLSEKRGKEMEKEHMEYCARYASVENKEMGWWVVGEVELREIQDIFIEMGEVTEYQWESYRRK